MLQAYIRGAMARAHYESLEDDDSYYGEIPQFDGVYANAGSLEKCREELEEVLEEWVLFRVIPQSCPPYGQRNRTASSKGELSAAVRTDKQKKAN